VAVAAVAVARAVVERAAAGSLARVKLELAIALLASLITGCSDSACDKEASELSSLRTETIRGAPAEVLRPWQAKLEAAQATCAREKRSDRLARVADIQHAIEMRGADLSIEEGEKARAARSASAAPPPVPKWTVHCADVVHDGGFHGLLAAGLPRNVAGFLHPDPHAEKNADAGASVAPPHEALILGGRSVYLSSRSGKLEGAIFDGSRFVAQQSLGWPAEAAREGAAVDRIIAARGEDTLAIVWIADLRVFFAVLDVASERWSAFAELAISGDDGGRDLKLGDLTWGRASFGLVLATAGGFAFAEVLADGRMARPAKLQPAYVAGVPRIAWDGQQFMIAAGRPDGEPSMGIWRAPTGAAPATLITLLDRVVGDGALAPLIGELVAKDDAVHLAFQVRVSPLESTTYLGHTNGTSSQLENCP